MNGPNLGDWIGREERQRERVEPARAQAMQATLDLGGPTPSPRPAPGAPLPPLWHWLYFWQIAPLSGLGPDGHPARGGFLPPVPLQRRMWAGGRLSFPGALIVGEEAERRSVIQDVREKEGRSGRLVFVTVRHELGEPGADPAVIEEQDIVYRDAPEGPYAPPPGKRPEREPDWRVAVTPSPTQLFRYSALTFNGHRIHYDADYARDVEGYPGLIVHGPLLGTLLLEQFRRQRPEVSVTKYQFRALRPIFDIAPFTVAGCADGTLWIEDPEGMMAMEATAA